MIRDGQIPLWIYGFVRYKDFLGDMHEMRFCKKFIRVFPGEIYIFDDWTENKKYTESY